MASAFFGSPRDQPVLLQLARHGEVRKSSSQPVSRALWRSGIIAEVSVRGKATLVLDARHPAYENIRAALAGLVGGPPPALTLGPKPKSEYRWDVSRPLGHRSPHAFRLLYHLINSGQAYSLDGLERQLPHISRTQLTTAIKDLTLAGIVDRSSERIRVAECVPNSYREAVLEVGKVIAKRDTRLLSRAILPRRRGSYCRADDGAPLLFGADIRLRNLMALAKYGPLYTKDLGRITRSTSRVEGTDNAPFGRGGLARHWNTEFGPAADLDPAHPLWLLLRALLLKLEEIYPLPPAPQYRRAPTSPLPRAWNGDKHALFGSAIATNILMTIGSLGWTFEALCVSTCVGYDRVVVKKVLKRLESFGVLEASRERRPGFNVRILRIADSFRACNELKRLLEMAVDIWPEFAERTSTAMQQLSSRTKAHLRKCGLPLRTSKRLPRKKWCRLSDEQRRIDCVQQYCALVALQKRDLASYEVNRISSILYRNIKRLWGSFSAFRTDLRLEPKMNGVTQRPNATLRERCIREYFALTAELGYQPNTTILNRAHAWLLQLIRTQWAGFPQFCDDLQIQPARRKRSGTASIADKKRDAIAEYYALARRMGHTPLMRDLDLHTSGLYKRICALWGGLRLMRQCFSVDAEAIR